MKKVSTAKCTAFCIVEVKTKVVSTAKLITILRSMVTKINYLPCEIQWASVIGKMFTTSFVCIFAKPHTTIWPIIMSIVRNYGGRESHVTWFS